MSEDNSHAGQGAVLLDIGDTIGALVVRMPPELLGREIEARPLRPHHHNLDDHHPHHPHAAVINRPGDGHRAEPVPSLVLAELEQGDYELYERPNGPIGLITTIIGGEVTRAEWSNPVQPSCG